mmetsp:Transcript_1706/g.6274  ORF Transcript_1706/g.6274 Transcript_1706/m.6274 type:complete len:236 (+) Transcript_1706:1920-2627(+)
MQERTCTQVDCRLLPFASAALMSARSACTFFTCIDAGECRSVSFAREVVKASRSVSIPRAAVRRMACVNPSRQSDHTASSSTSSNVTESAARIGGHATSRSGCTLSTESVVWNWPAPARRCSSRTASMTASLASLPIMRERRPGRRFIKTSRPIRLDRRPAALSATALSAEPLASSAVSFILISLFTMASYTASMNAWGKSEPSSIPRLFRRNSALLIFFFTFGLCASVLSMMTE